MHNPNEKHRPIMTTADLALRYDNIYQPIAKHYLKEPESLLKILLRLGLNLLIEIWDQK